MGRKPSLAAFCAMVVYTANLTVALIHWRGLLTLSRNRRVGPMEMGMDIHRSDSRRPIDG